MGGSLVKDYIIIKPSPKKLHKECNKDIWALFKDNKLMVLNRCGEYILPTLKDIRDYNINIFNIQCIGEYEGVNLMCGETDDELQKAEVEYVDLMTLGNSQDEFLYTIATKGNLLLNWLKLNKHCGICGSENYIKDSYNERALVCTKCGNTTWPRTSPAIIVAVIKDDKLLMVHNKLFPNRKYGLVAGFVEYGETFEDCVKREVYEETGIKVKNIRYFGSQPWPFPNSMMVGFTAEYQEGELNPDGVEISHAAWFSREEVLKIYKKSFSIGSKLIQWFLENY